MEDAPWAEWGRAEKPISAIKMAAILKHYEIAPHAIRDGEKVFKGYERDDFKDAWNRYLPPAPGEPVTAVTRLQLGASGVDKPNGNEACNSVTDLGPSPDGTGDGFWLKAEADEGVL
jgi:hypothetical protein